MSIFKVIVTYPNAEVEEIEQDFYHLDKAIEYAEHILGEVQYNAPFHADSLDDDGDVISVEPYAIVKELENNEAKVVYDSRKK